MGEKPQGEDWVRNVLKLGETIASSLHWWCNTWLHKSFFCIDDHQNKQEYYFDGKYHLWDVLKRVWKIKN